MVSLTAEGTVDDRMKEIVTEKIANIGKVSDESKKKTIKSLLKMFKKMKKNKDILGSDSEED
jgi:hypothetical protein